MRILVVEDEHAVATALERGLRREGFEVSVAHDGDDGLWLARERSFDAIVLDIMLPGRNGFQVCRTLRDEGNWTPILMLTAKEGEYDEAEGLDTGADDYLRKPFSFVVLVARLRALLRRGGSAAADARLEAAGLVLDRGQMRVGRGDEQVDLTPREFAVLELLARRCPDVVSKRTLLDAVWGLDFDGDPNIVEVYVGYLRKKLGKGAVRTVRGAGYQLRGTGPAR